VLCWGLVCATACVMRACIGRTQDWGRMASHQGLCLPPSTLFIAQVSTRIPRGDSFIEASFTSSSSPHAYVGWCCARGSPCDLAPGPVAESHPHPSSALHSVCAASVVFWLSLCECVCWVWVFRELAGLRFVLCVPFLITRDQCLPCCASCQVPCHMSTPAMGC
jgi:hypothetical protein